MYTIQNSINIADFLSLYTNIFIVKIYGNKMAPRVGFEPTTLRLTAECSTAELSGNAVHFDSGFPIIKMPKESISLITFLCFY